MSPPRMAALGIIIACCALSSSAQDELTLSVAGAPSAETEQLSESLMQPPEEAWLSPEVAAPRMEGHPLKRSKPTGALPLRAESQERVGRSWWRTVVSLAGVVALILLLAWGYRQMAGAGGRLSLAGRARHAGVIEVVGRASLSARQSVCLLRVGPRLVLVGMSAERVEALDVIDDADFAARLGGEAARRRSDSASAEFNHCLGREAQSYEPEELGLDETLLPSESRLVDVKQKLIGTMQRVRAAMGQS
ncbi:MAG: flagellar biosynthetic protein FliO [Planctomycetes bacterium]|nr:flagellar biosynthetic protein FliO [Planctomycetota bacterium]